MTALMFCASLWLVPLSLLLDSPWTLQPTALSLAAEVVLAMGPTAIATVLILIIIDRQGASFLSQINFMIPVFGMLFGVVLLGEHLPANAYLALVIILTGIAVSRRRQPRDTMDRH
jgi:drug/metabolite transporter (DMT)-like permease